MSTTTAKAWKARLAKLAAKPCEATVNLDPDYPDYKGRPCSAPRSIVFSNDRATAFLVCPNGHAEQRVRIRPRCGCEARPLHYQLRGGLVVEICTVCNATWRQGRP